MRKVTALALLALGLSGVAAAGTYSPAVCTNHAVTVPCEDTAWDIGFEVFWVEATNSDQIYAFADLDANAIVPSMNTQPRYSYYTIDPNYEFGFEVEASYHFGTGSDVTVSWERTHDENTQSIVLDETKLSAVNASVETYGAGIRLTGGGMPTAHDEAHATLDYQFDAVNVELGQHIDVGNDMDLRIHAGMQYARIDLAKKVTEGAHNSDLFHVWESDFDGVGARVGADGAIYLANGFSLVSHAAVALLAGDIQSHYKAIDRTVKPHERFTCDIEHDSVLIPTAMLKSGVHYSADFYGGNASIEAGWRFETYIDAVRLNSTVVGGASMGRFDFNFGRGAGDANENFTFHGPYVAVKYVS